MRLGFVRFLLVGFLVGCGGSSSETPWPAEPEGKTIGPAGELSPSGLVEGAPPPARDAGPGPSVDP